jgi:DNA-binding MurR/RpiR family transcriptional regulator
MAGESRNVGIEGKVDCPLSSSAAYPRLWSGSDSAARDVAAWEAQADMRQTASTDKVGRMKEHEAKSYEFISRRIIEQYATLPGALQRAANVISQNPNDIAILNLTQLSGRYGVPASNFVRLSKLLKLEGFGELQSAYRSRLIDIIPSLSARLARYGDEFDGHEATGNRAEDRLSRLIKEDLRLLSTHDIPALDKSCRGIAEVLASSRRVYVLAAHRFIAAASYLEFLLTYIGIDARTLHNYGFWASEHVKNMTPEDTVLVMTFHYYHREIVGIIDAANKSGVKICAITDYEFSPMVGPAKRIIFLPGLEHNFKVSVAPLIMVVQHIANEAAHFLGRAVPKGDASKRNARSRKP